MSPWGGLKPVFFYPVLCSTINTDHFKKQETFLFKYTTEYNLSNNVYSWSIYTHIYKWEENKNNTVY